MHTKILTIAVAAVFLAACSDDNGVPTPDTGTDGPPVSVDGGDDGPPVTTDGPPTDVPPVTSDDPSTDGPPVTTDGPLTDGPPVTTDGPKPFDGPLADAPVGKLCGPIAGGTCAKNEVCNITGCAIGATGICVPKPTACAKIYMPVCGCDDQTYGNDCLRLQAGVALKHTGACTTQVDGGLVFDGSVAIQCGPWPGGNCPKGATCNILTCALGGSGTCVPTPKVCPKILAPVCGCDGKTYGNDCLRIQAGAALDHTGACVVTPPADGGAGMTCGGTSGVSCATGYVCDIHSCPKSATGVCVVQPTACPFVWAPVCGCDNLTYSNNCVRLTVGTPLKHIGQCVSTAFDAGP